jgi:hypothetical protein
MFDKDEARCVALALLASRATGATVCPSEVARRLAGAPKALGAEPEWRSAMPVVHAAMDELVNERAIALSWKGKRLVKRAGPYRIGRVSDN